MCGVIDENGVQWERCNVCSNWTDIDSLGYEPPSKKYEHGRDICLDCTNKHHDIESIQPAASWIANYS